MRTQETFAVFLTITEHELEKEKARAQQRKLEQAIGLLQQIPKTSAPFSVLSKTFEHLHVIAEEIRDQYPPLPSFFPVTEFFYNAAKRFGKLRVLAEYIAESCDFTVVGELHQQEQEMLKFIAESVPDQVPRVLLEHYREYIQQFTQRVYSLF